MLCASKLHVDERPRTDVLVRPVSVVRVRRRTHSRNVEECVLQWKLLLAWILKMLSRQSTGVAVKTALCEACCEEEML